MMKSKMFLHLEDVKSGEEEEKVEIPDFASVHDFEKYLPWACNQHQLNLDVVVTRKWQRDLPPPVELGSKSKTKKAKIFYVESVGHFELFKADLEDCHSESVRLTTTYDKNNVLVQIKFDKCFDKPRPIMKILRIISPLYPGLSSIVIEPPVQTFIPYEIRRILEVSNVTDVCLDGCYLPERYQLILEGNCRLKSFSLARCSINDKDVEMLFKMLVHDTPASQSLSILNLSSNKISDLGARYISETLRCNRQLAYLNLCDNNIQDDGASEIFNVLLEFPLTDEEKDDYHKKHIDYVKTGAEYTEHVINELKLQNSSSFINTKDKKKLKHNLNQKSKSHNLSELLDKAKLMTEHYIGKFTHPYSDTFLKKGVYYCAGNNSLQVLNLAYNDLTYFSLKNLLNVLMYQKCLERRPVGLLHVQLIGNNIPYECKEWYQIEDMLETATETMSAALGKMPQAKKRSLSTFSKGQ